MGTEDEGFVAWDGWVRLGPCGGFDLLLNSGRLIGQQTFLFGGDEVADVMKRGGDVGIFGVASGDEDLAGGRLPGCGGGRRCGRDLRR
jgi:hypothetical protein